MTDPIRLSQIDEAVFGEIVPPRVQPVRLSNFYGVPGYQFPASGPIRLSDFLLNADLCVVYAWDVARSSTQLSFTPGRLLATGPTQPPAGYPMVADTTLGPGRYYFEVQTKDNYTYDENGFAFLAPKIGVAGPGYMGLSPQPGDPLWFFEFADTNVYAIEGTLHCYIDTVAGKGWVGVNGYWLKADGTFDEDPGSGQRRANVPRADSTPHFTFPPGPVSPFCQSVVGLIVTTSQDLGYSAPLGAASLSDVGCLPELPPHEGLWLVSRGKGVTVEGEVLDATVIRDFYGMGQLSLRRNIPLTDVYHMPLGVSPLHDLNRSASFQLPDGTSTSNIGQSARLFLDANFGQPPYTYAAQFTVNEATANPGAPQITVNSQSATVFVRSDSLAGSNANARRAKMRVFVQPPVSHGVCRLYAYIHHPSAKQAVPLPASLFAIQITAQITATDALGESRIATFVFRATGDAYLHAQMASDFALATTSLPPFGAQGSDRLGIVSPRLTPAYRDLLGALDKQAILDNFGPNPQPNIVADRNFGSPQHVVSQIEARFGGVLSVNPKTLNAIVRFRSNRRDSVRPLVSLVQPQFGLDQFPPNAVTLESLGDGTYLLNVKPPPKALRQPDTYFELRPSIVATLGNNNPDLAETIVVPFLTSYYFEPLKVFASVLGTEFRNNRIAKQFNRALGETKAILYDETPVTPFQLPADGNGPQATLTVKVPYTALSASNDANVEMELLLPAASGADIESFSLPQATRNTGPEGIYISAYGELIQELTPTNVYVNTNRVKFYATVAVRNGNFDQFNRDVAHLARSASLRVEGQLKLIGQPAVTVSVQIEVQSAPALTLGRGGAHYNRYNGDSGDIPFTRNADSTSDSPPIYYDRCYLRTVEQGDTADAFFSGTTLNLSAIRTDSLSAQSVDTRAYYRRPADTIFASTRTYPGSPSQTNAVVGERPPDVPETSLPDGSLILVLRPIANFGTVPHNVQVSVSGSPLASVQQGMVVVRYDHRSILNEGYNEQFRGTHNIIVNVTATDALDDQRTHSYTIALTVEDRGY